MRLLGRHVSDYGKNLSRIPAFALYAARCAVTFRHPARFLKGYITRQVPPEGVLHLRNGYQMALSGDPDDLVTAFLIWGKNEYGGVPKDGIVVDIGANVGAFSLYAASRGARKVYAYEPCRQSLACIQKSARLSHLEAVIVAQQIAVAGQGGAKVPFPIHSSVINSLLPNKRKAVETELVETLDLAGVLAANHLGRVDLLKLDCEGSEYEILLGAAEETLAKIGAIKVEYHQGAREKLIERLQKSGFRLTHSKRDTPKLGVLWFEKTAP